MRREQAALVAGLVLVGGCDRIPDDAHLRGTYVGTGRNGLCIDAPLGSPDLGFYAVAYGKPDGHCVIYGSAKVAGDRMTFSANEDAACRFTGLISGGTVTFPANLPVGCRRYCKGSASLAAQTFTYSAEATGKEHHGTVLDPSGESAC